VNTEFPEIRELLDQREGCEPPDGYFEEFLEEFHRRQREDVLRRSARSLLLERVSVWLREMGPAKWAYAGGLAYVAVLVGFLLLWLPGEGDREGLMLPGRRALEGAAQERVLHFSAEGGEEEISEPTEF